ncbi:MAG: type II toxin-antitoxin system RelE/ParE family toxin [Bacteroidetes bacterium]|nr:type II toxin-antitoxin system RelE/ParE family toxin [Bacteroidota bacterium]
MKYKLIVEDTADFEVSKAYAYYEDLQTNLGERFLNRWEEQIKLIEKNPLLYSIKYKQFRQVLLRPFPYHIIYEIEGNLVVVYRVVYAGKHPRKRYKKKIK